MGSEPWLLEQQYRESSLRLQRFRPICRDCGQQIASALCLPVEDGYLCRDCVKLRLVDTDSVE